MSRPDQLVESRAPAPSPAPDPGIGRHLALVFLASLVFYVVWYWGVEHWRHRRSPWEVTFRVEAGGDAMLEVAQAELGIRDVRITVRGAGLAPGSGPVTVRFDQPTKRDAVPFGTVRFLDTTIWPGTVTVAVGGHEIELLPRVLILDKEERAWQTGARHELRAVR